MYVYIQEPQFIRENLFTKQFTISFTIYGLLGYIRGFPSEIEAIRGGVPPPSK